MGELDGGRVYIYTRVSTEMQIDGYSLNAQREMLQEFAKLHKMQIVREYSDEGKSGTNKAGREQYLQMMDDIEFANENIDYVLVFKLSRFGRNAADILSSLQLMEDFGVGLFCVKDGIDSKSGAGKLIISVMSSVVEIEHDNILAQTMEGRLQKAREGRWNGGFAPYGYRLENGELQVEEAEAEVIRTIFDKFVNTSLGANGVAKWLNAHGIKKMTRQNGTLELFSAHFVKLVLDNPVYCGKIAYGRRKHEKIKGSRNEKHVVKQQDYPVYAGIHEAIVSEELWNNAHEKRVETGFRHEKKEEDHEYVLSGLVKCPVCGAPMYGIPSRKKRKDGTPYPVSYSYACRNKTRQSGHSCQWKRQVACKKIDKGVEEILYAVIHNEQFSEAVKDTIGLNIDISSLEKERETYRNMLRQATGKQKKLEQQLDALDVTSPTYDSKYESLDRRLDKVLEEKITLQHQMDDVAGKIRSVKENQLTRDTIFEYLIKFDEVYAIMTDADKKRVLQDLIKSVNIFPEKQEDGRWVKSICFRFPISYNGSLVDEIFPPKEKHVETVVLLSRKNIDTYIEFELDTSVLEGNTGASATYEEIKEYVFEQTGLKVSSLYIGQIKDKCGIKERVKYNLGSGKGRVPICPRDKEDAIKDAFKYFGMI